MIDYMIHVYKTINLLSTDYGNEFRKHSRKHPMSYIEVIKTRTI